MCAYIKYPKLTSKIIVLIKIKKVLNPIPKPLCHIGIIFPGYLLGSIGFGVAPHKGAPLKELEHDKVDHTMFP
ncbi:hypothetical protein J6W34_01905 [bacterium]|nr:hypothetical protein [bacterium]